MRVLITGITGFAGSHLAEHILSEHAGVAVFGTYRWRSRMENLETIRRHDTKIRMHVAGSSEEYGMVYPDEVPMKETNPLRPLSPYAVSKVTQDRLAYQYFKSYGLHIVVTRGFNHTGPRRGTHFSTSTFARQIALIEAGRHEPIVYVGDLTSKRDWTDVRDM